MTILGIDNPHSDDHIKSTPTLPKKTRTKRATKKILSKQESSLFSGPKKAPLTAKSKESILGIESFRAKKHQVIHPSWNQDMPVQAPPGFQEALETFKKVGAGFGEGIGAGGIGGDFPQGDVGQPFWFSNIGGNHFPREGFTYKPYDTAVVPLKTQVQGYFDDADARMGVDFLAAKVTGGQHYFKAKTKNLSSYVEKWTKDVNLDWLNWSIAKELLAFGNCFVRCRVPIWEATKPDDFHIIPIESAARIWWTPDRRPLWYEFRGAEYNGYFRPGEVIHFSWNQTNGQLYGFGIMGQLTNRVAYQEDTPDGPVMKERESLLDIKHSMQNVFSKIAKRYLPRLVIDATNAAEDTRDAIREELRVLHDSEDIVHGVKGLKVETINNDTRPVDITGFMDFIQSDIFKALQTSKGRIAGQSAGPSYANGEESAILDEVGLSQFPNQLKFMIETMIVKPWYEFNRETDEFMWNGAIAVPWKEADFSMEFGKQSKKDLEPEQVAQWVQILQQAGQISGIEIRKIAEKVGVPELLSDLEGGMAPDMPGLTGLDGGGGTPLEDATSQMKKSPTGSGDGDGGSEHGVENNQQGPGMTQVPGSPKKSSRSRA